MPLNRCRPDPSGLSQSLSAGRETGGWARFSGWVPLGRSDPIQPLSRPFPKFATGPSMAVDATDLGALEKALNDAAGKASVLWTTFVTFELYLAIAFGAVTHRDLFLETPVKLPILTAGGFLRGRASGVRDLSF